MGAQPFDLIQGPLLEAVERLVVAEHEALFRTALGEEWSRPLAYRWIRYEDPDPVARLIDATERLDREWLAAPAAARAGWLRKEAERWPAVLRLARAAGFG